MSYEPNDKQAAVYPTAPPPTYQDDWSKQPQAAPAGYPPYPVSAGATGYGGYPGASQPPYPAVTSPQMPYTQPAPPYGSSPYQTQSQGGSYIGPYGAETGYHGAAVGNEQSNPEEEVMTSNWAGSSFADKKIRHHFIKKVYLILMSQLLFTFGIICVFFFSKDVKCWVQHNVWFYYCSYAVFLITYFTLICCADVRRRWPANFICLAIFTSAFSYMAGTITSFYDVNSVLVAVGITAAVCLSISLFAIQTRIDFTLCSGLIFALCVTLILFGFACMITYLVAGYNYIMHCVYGGLAALVFSLFLVFDTQMVVGGSNRKYQLSPEEHIFGALQLYIDIVNLFVIVLGLVGGRRS